LFYLYLAELNRLEIYNVAYYSYVSIYMQYKFTTQYLAFR